MLTQEDLPGWVQTTATLLLGAGAARMLAVVLENSRLSKREYRETLLERIRELEKVVEGLQGRLGDLRVELAVVKEENEQLRERVEGGSGGVHDPLPGPRDGRPPA